MRFKLEQDISVSFQMAPMIDVVFQLLIFFLVGASYKQTESDLRVDLPNPGEGPKPPVVMQVEILADGAIIANDVICDSPTSRELPQLRSKLTELLRIDRDVPVIIVADPDTAYQRVVDVLNACKATGVVNISFAGAGRGGG